MAAPDGDIQIGGDLRQQRIGDPHHALGGEGGNREEDDGADGVCRAARDGCRAKLTLGGWRAS